MQSGQTVKTWTFQLSSIQAASTQGSDVNFVVPGTVTLTNSSNQFVAYVSQASIPKFRLPISSAYGNNTFSFKLQGYVDSVYQNVVQNTNPWQKVEKWMDCTEIQTKYINPYIETGVYPFGSYQAVYANPPNYSTVDNYCDNIVVTVADGVYFDQAALTTAVNTALQTTITTLNAKFNRDGNLNPPFPPAPSGGYYKGPQATDGPPSFNQFQPTWFLQMGVAPNGNQTNWTVQSNNNFGWLSRPPVTQISTGIRAWTGSGVKVLKYRVYIYANEICSMLGFGDEDFLLDTSTLTEGYQVQGLGLQDAPNFFQSTPAIAYTSPYDVDVNPNDIIYISCTSLTQQNSFISAPIINLFGRAISNGQLINSSAIAAVYVDENTSISRSIIDYSQPTRFFILDKVINIITIQLRDYRNRPIPITFLGKPFFIQLVVEEIANLNPQIQTMNLQQFYDIESQFFKNKELELAYRLENFIREER